MDIAAEVGESVDYQNLDGAVNQLKTVDHRRYMLVMLRYFAALTEQQIADTLEVTKKTIRAAKVFLLMRMQG